MKVFRASASLTLLLVALFAGAQEKNAVPALSRPTVLRSTVEVTSGVLTLSDLLPDDAGARLRAAAGTIELGHAPQPGRQRVLESGQITRGLAARPALLRQLSVPARITVRRAGWPISRAAVEKAVARFLPADDGREEPRTGRGGVAVERRNQRGGGCGDRSHRRPLGCAAEGAGRPHALCRAFALRQFSGAGAGSQAGAGRNGRAENFFASSFLSSFRSSFFRSSFLSPRGVAASQRSRGTLAIPEIRTHPGRGGEAGQAAGRRRRFSHFDAGDLSATRQDGTNHPGPRRRRSPCFLGGSDRRWTVAGHFLNPQAAGAQTSCGKES